MPGDDTGIEMKGSAAAGVGLYSGPASAMWRLARTLPMVS
jgi:hypothetical protein